MKRIVLNILALALAVTLCGQVVIQPEQPQGPVVGPPLGQLPAQPVKARLTAPEPPPGATADKLPQALDDVIAGKLAVDDVQVFCRSEEGDFVLYGPRFGFVGSTQIKPGKDTILTVLKRIRKAGVASMPDTFGGNPMPNIRGPRPMMPVQLLREFSVTIGSVHKSVTQLAGGEQSAELVSLTTDIQKELAPLAEKGLKLDGLSLKEGLALLTKGKLAPEALTISFASTPKKDINHPLIMVIQSGQIRIGIDRVKAARADVEATIKRLAGLLADKDLATFPKQLQAPDALIGLDVQLQGIVANLNVSGDVGPYNQQQAKANPEAQKAFEQIVAELRRAHTGFAASQPDSVRN